MKSDGNNFVASALELEKICEKDNRQLIIRDWSYINFMPDKENDYNPSQRLLILEALKGKCKLIPFAFVRDAVDIYTSFLNKKTQFPKPVYKKPMSFFPFFHLYWGLLSLANFFVGNFVGNEMVSIAVNKEMQAC